MIIYISILWTPSNFLNTAPPLVIYYVMWVLNWDQTTFSLRKDEFDPNLTSLATYNTFQNSISKCSINELYSCIMHAMENVTHECHIKDKNNIHSLIHI
jgi:hypothetical protein